MIIDTSKLTELNDVEADEVYNALISLLDQSIIGKNIVSFTSSKIAEKHARIKLASKKHEVFAAFMLDTKNNVIDFVELSSGTIDQCSVYPREVLKKVLELNANSVIFAHNHPSGDTTPSEDDKKITRVLKEALALIDVDVLDHIIVSESNTFSFAQNGII